MDITVENKDIGFVENNMKIKYKFDAFPYIDHGVLYGEVESISPSAALNENNNMVYHVKGTLNELNFNIGERLYPIKAGMTANAEIITEKMSIFSIIFRKFKRIDSIPK